MSDVPGWVYKLWRFLHRSNDVKPAAQPILPPQPEQPRLEGIALVFTNGRIFVINYDVPLDLSRDDGYADLCAAESQGKRINSELHLVIKERDDPDG